LVHRSETFVPIARRGVLSRSRIAVHRDVHGDAYKQPQFTAASTVASDVPDVVPPEGVTSGTVAPMIEPKENI